MARKDLRAERKWRPIPRVQDIGFFQGLLVSRQRLVGVALGVTLGAMAVIYGVSTWMRTISGSPMVNVLIIASMLTGLIIAAYLDALMLGDLFFPGRWRERILQGRNFKPQNWEEEEAAVKEYNAPFFLIMIVTLLLLTWVSQLLTSGFLSYYQNVGFALTLMRSDDPADRLMGLEEMANPLREAYWTDDALHAQIADLIDDPEPDVQRMAAYAAGRLNVVKAGDAMLDVFRDSDDAEVRGDVAMALGRLRWERALAYLAARLKAAEVDEVEALGILRGFALMKDRRAGSAVVAYLEDCTQGGVRRVSEDAMVSAFFALRRMEFDGAVPIARDVLAAKRCQPSDLERCAAADTLRYVAGKDDLAFLQRLYPSIDAQQVCDYAMWRLREEKAIELVEPEPLRAKLVRAVGNRHDFETYEWIWSVGADEGEHHATRKVAESYTREMLEAYQADKKKRR